MRTEHLLQREAAARRTLRRTKERAGPSFLGVLNQSIQEKTVTGKNQGAMQAFLQQALPEDGSPISQREGRFCAVCGCMIDEDGKCPLCIVPLELPVNPLALSQNGAQANSPYPVKSTYAVSENASSLAPKAGRRAGASFPAVHNHAPLEKAADEKQPRKPRDLAKPLSEEDGRDVSKPGTNVCPVCGCTVDAQGICPLCAAQLVPLPGSTGSQKPSAVPAASLHPVSGNGAAAAKSGRRIAKLNGNKAGPA